MEKKKKGILNPKKRPRRRRRVNQGHLFFHLEKKKKRVWEWNSTFLKKPKFETKSSRSFLAKVWHALCKKKRKNWRRKSLNSCCHLTISFRRCHILTHASIREEEREKKKSGRGSCKHRTRADGHQKIHHHHHLSLSLPNAIGFRNTCSLSLPDAPFDRWRPHAVT